VHLGDHPTNLVGHFGGLQQARASLADAYLNSMLSVGRPEPLNRQARDETPLAMRRSDLWGEL
jgi:hypothetical protein